jgi:hypothetical protein
MFPTRNEEPFFLKFGNQFSRPFLHIFLLVNLLTCAVFEVLIITDSRTRRTELPERNRVLMVHHSIYLKYVECGAIAMHA